MITIQNHTSRKWGCSTEGYRSGGCNLHYCFLATFIPHSLWRNDGVAAASM